MDPEQQIFQEAVAALNQRRVRDAELLFRKFLRTQPTHVPALNLLTVVLMSMERFAEAEKFIEKAVKVDQNSDASFYNYGMILKRLGRPTQAKLQFDRALQLNSQVYETWNSRGTVFNDLRQYDRAICDFDRAVSLKPDSHDAFCNKGKSLLGLKRHGEALTAYDKALAIRPDLAEAWLGRGKVFADLRRYEEALVAFDKALAFKPDLAEAWLGRGIVSADLGRFDQAFAAYDKALALRPDLSEAWLCRGDVHGKLKRHDEALADYDKALALSPYLAEVWLGRGNILRDVKHYEEALVAYGKALELKPSLAEAWLGRGHVFAELKRYYEAFAAYNEALALKPDLEYAEAARLRAKMQLCDWGNFDNDCKHLFSAIEAGTLSEPFTLLSLSPSPEMQLKNARLYSKQIHTTSDQQLWRGTKYNHDRIRVAYLSADFGEHAVTALLAGLFEEHDREHFETFGISFQTHNSSETLSRVKNAFDRFLGVEDQDDFEVAKLLRELEIDIAVDLMGYTINSRTSIFARRPSPIQINYLGFPGTMGAHYIDYIMADRFIIPEAQRQFYEEKIIYLPDSFQANDPKRKIGTTPSSRAEVGLPENAFAFCAFNNSYKINPICFAAWMRILDQTGGSVLWLLGGDEQIERNLRREAEYRGVNSSRLIFASRIPYANYLARYRLADLFLDTFPFNGGTTASDALWVGLPLITCPGETFASRMAGSLLKAVGLPEMIAKSISHYEALACELASNPSFMKSIRRKLTANLNSCSLFDTESATRHIEAAYTAVHQRVQNDLPPTDVDVAPSATAGGRWP